MSKQGFEVPVVANNELEDLRRLSDALTEYINSLLNMIRNHEDRIKELED